MVYRPFHIEEDHPRKRAVINQNAASLAHLRFPVHALPSPVIGSEPLIFRK